MQYPWEEFARVASSEFVIFAMPKTGTRSLIKWQEDNNLPAITATEDQPCTYTKLDFYSETRDMYMVWRPPYRRILTGLNTAFNRIAWDIVQQDAPEIRIEFANALANFSTSLDFNSHLVIQNHTLTMREPPLPVTWIHLDQLRWLHEHLNSRYEKHYTQFDQINRGDGGDKNSSTNFVPVEEFEKILLSAYPAVSLAISFRSSLDFIPEKIINL